MGYEASAHEVQITILRHLLFQPTAGFAELQKTSDFTSDHFNFHVKKLLTSGLIEKTDDGYRLTSTGKEYANRLDTDENVIEKQPKVSVALIIERTNDGKQEFLVQQRLKHPYFGFWGRLGGKVRWGESFEEAAKRELKEETGLDGAFVFKSIFRKRDYDKDSGRLLEDKVFIIMYTDNAAGKLITDFEGGHNEWLTNEGFWSKDKVFESAIDFSVMIDNDERYRSQEYHYDHTEY